MVAKLQVSIGALMVMLAAATTEAHAETLRAFIDGSSLHNACQDKSMFCSGFIAGVADTDRSYMDMTKKCLYVIPREAKLSQLVAIVGKYLGDHPEELHFDAGSLVYKALSAAFPCK